jgi:hypothetical protein
VRAGQIVHSPTAEALGLSVPAPTVLEPAPAEPGPAPAADIEPTDAPAAGADNEQGES